MVQTQNVTMLHVNVNMVLCVCVGGCICSLAFSKKDCVDLFRVEPGPPEESVATAAGLCCPV